MVESAASKDYLNVGKMEALQGVLANGKSNIFVEYEPSKSLLLKKNTISYLQNELIFTPESCPWSSPRMSS